MYGFTKKIRPSVAFVSLMIGLAGWMTPRQLFSQVTMSNISAENVLKGNYNPLDYASSNAITDKNQVINLINQNVSADSLKHYLTKIETFGNRNTGSDTLSTLRGIGATRRWIRQKFLDFSSRNENRLLVSYLNFNSNICGMTEHRNVLAVLPGMDTSRKDVIVIEAHMDSRCKGGCDTSCYAPGMDDNGSGTALVIELVRVMSQFTFDRSIVFTTVTGEEQGLNGGAAMAEYLDNNSIELLACLNNDVVGGVECGPKSSPPSCSPVGSIDSMNLRVFSWSPGNDTSFVSIHKQLARFVKLQQIEEINPITGVNTNLVLQIREDRQGRGGDHIPFRQRQMRAIRFTSSNEHGDGSGTGPDRQHTTTDVLGYDLSSPPDGILDTFLIDFNYLRRNALTNGVNLAQLANSPRIPEPIYERTDFGNVYAIRFENEDTLYQHRIGVRSNSSNDLYFDSVLTFSQHKIDFWDLYPSGNVQLHAMNFDGKYESIPSLHEEEAYLSVESIDKEVKCQEFFPNPAHDVLNLRWICDMEINTIRLILYSNLGQSVMDVNITRGEVRRGISINLPDLPQGIYQLVSILNNDEKYVESLIIE